MIVISVKGLMIQNPYTILRVIQYPIAVQLAQLMTTNSTNNTTSNKNRRELASLEKPTSAKLLNKPRNMNWKTLYTVFIKFTYLHCIEVLIIECDVMEY